MPVIVCPHCGLGADFPIFASSEDLRNAQILAAIGFCKLCRGRVFFELLNANQERVISSYPQTQAKVPQELPDPVKKAFEEAQICLAANAPNGALLMCRRAVQEALDDLKAPKGDLPTQLKALVDNHTITPALKEWADHARIGGRIAAHGTGGADWGEPQLQWGSQEDAQAVIEFCNAFFEYVYVMPERNRQRRANTLDSPANRNP